VFYNFLHKFSMEVLGKTIQYNKTISAKYDTNIFHDREKR